LSDAVKWAYGVRVERRNGREFNATERLQRQRYTEEVLTKG
jgi:hypothetical protein